MNLYPAAGGNTPTPVTVTMTLNHGYSEFQLVGDTDAGGALEIWPQMVEKALVKWIGQLNGTNTTNYANVQGMLPEQAFRYLTGFSGPDVTAANLSAIGPSAYNLQALISCRERDMLSAHPCIPVLVAATNTTFPNGAVQVKLENGYVIYARHDYVIDSVNVESGTVTLHNPWDRLQSCTGGGSLVITIADFFRYFGEIAVGGAPP